MDILKNGPHLITVSAKDPGNMCRYMEPPNQEGQFDAGIRHKELRKHKIFSENKMTLKILSSCCQGNNQRGKSWEMESLKLVQNAKDLAGEAL